MIDDRELAQKELEILYSSDNIERSELILEIYRLLNSGSIKFKTCCEQLQGIDPLETDRFLTVVYGLYLYLHPDIATRSRCLKSEGEFGIQASRLIENRFTNKFDLTYMENSALLIQHVYAILNPIFETSEKSDDDAETVENAEIINPNMDLRIMYWVITTEKERLDQNLMYYSNPIDIFEGPAVSMFETLEKHKIESYGDAFNFVARLKSVMLEIHHLIQFMEKQRSLKGVEIPRVVAQQCFDMIQGFLLVEPENHTFMKNFKADIDTISISEDIYKIGLEFLSDSVYRALYHLGDWIQEFFLEEDEVPAERDDNDSKTDDSKTDDSEKNDNDNDEDDEYVVSDFSVCCDRNRGRKYYAYCLKHHTTTDLSPEEIHELGLKEVKRISEEILLNVQAYIQTLENKVEVSTFEEAVEYIRTLSADNANIYPDTLEGEAAILADIDLLDVKIKKLLPSLFVEGSLPEAECEYRFTPEHQKETMPAGYYFEPSFDGSNKGAFYMNLRSELLRFGLPTLVAHEAIPGHHFQLSSVSESDLHPIRKIEFYNIFNAYLEGWALYTERLCKEFNLYDEPITMIGHLMDEMLRASRLVIDTGIHHYGWNRQKALNYMCSVCPFPLKSNEIEIDRYIGWPGQACSYKVGQLKIIELRDQFIEKKGNTLQEFNTNIVRSGALPIDLL